MATEPEKTADDDPQKPSQLQPYATGNPPDPMEEYYKAHPERKLEVERAAAEAEKAKKESEPKIEPKVEHKAKPEPEEDDNNFRKGRK